ncbi:MAG TPA: polyprenyl synthetase family protein [Thermoanaerobaculia bacterium]|jgi:geranylgeranyl diphosphate synthase type I
MRFERLKERIRGIAEISSWPQALDLVERAVHREWISVWEYPVAACRAVGATEQDALPGAAAVFCSVLSIHLVDDMLDDDPRGDYRRLGAGPVANIALAFQAAGHRLLDDAAVRPEVRAALQESFAAMTLATCWGQELDTRELRSEEEYWRVVESKTPPLFAAAFRIGALLGGAEAGTADGLARLGGTLGRFIQVNDDLADALQAPACADWKRRHNNLPILYALTAGHAEREEFVRLSALVEEPAALAAAQKILFRSGAVSYCALKLIELTREVHGLFARIPLVEPEPVARLLDLHLKPLHKLLARVGIQEPAALMLA